MVRSHDLNRDQFTSDVGFIVTSYDLIGLRMGHCYGFESNFDVVPNFIETCS